MSKEFKRQDSTRYLKLGKRKSKIVWRRPKGRDSKMRLKRRNYPKQVSIGYKNPKKESPLLVKNLKDLGKTDKKTIIIAKVGAKKKLEIIKKANDLGLQILNLKEDKK